MKKIDEEYMLYLHYKTIQTCICCDTVNDVENILGKYIIKSPEFCLCLLNPEWAYKILKTFLEAHKNYMDKQMKENAFHVLWFFEKIYIHIDKKALTELTNELKIMINSSNDTNIKKMLSEELITRLIDKKEILHSYIEQNNITNYVKNMICNDLHVLISHSPIYTKESFNSLAIQYLEDTKSYIASINTIITEYPEIKLNQVFTERVQVVLEKMNDKKEKKLSLREKRLYKNFVKKITK